MWNEISPRSARSEGARAARGADLSGSLLAATPRAACGRTWPAADRSPHAATLPAAGLASGRPFTGRSDAPALPAAGPGQRQTVRRTRRRHALPGPEVECSRHPRGRPFAARGHAPALPVSRVPAATLRELPYPGDPIGQLTESCRRVGRRLRGAEQEADARRVGRTRRRAPSTRSRKVGVAPATQTFLGLPGPGRTRGRELTRADRGIGAPIGAGLSTMAAARTGAVSGGRRRPRRRARRR